MFVNKVKNNVSLISKHLKSRTMTCNTSIIADTFKKSGDILLYLIFLSTKTTATWLTFNMIDGFFRLSVLFDLDGLLQI
jgi:hypothetical protein